MFNTTATVRLLRLNSSCVFCGAIESIYRWACLSLFVEKDGLKAQFNYGVCTKIATRVSWWHLDRTIRFGVEYWRETRDAVEEETRPLITLSSRAWKQEY